MIRFCPQREQYSPLAAAAPQFGQAGSVVSISIHKLLAGAAALSEQKAAPPLARPGSATAVYLISAALRYEAVLDQAKARRAGS